MPSISKIRLTNVVYEEGNKRYNDEMFLFDGHNGAILLENGGGKTVLIQTAMQAILPHVDLADRKIKNTLVLENAPAHIAIEWIINDKPRRYVVTAVSLYTTKQGLDSLRYVYEYDANDPNGIEGIPFVRDGVQGKRTAERGEMLDYYSQMRDRTFSARTFDTIKDFKQFIEEQYHIISSEWESIAKINSSEGGVEAFFDNCKSTNQLFDRLLIPTVESSIVGHNEKLFADMFEQQHTSFKNYKRLKETLEENKLIQHQLESYVGTYQKLHELEIKYEETKQMAKGVWNLTLEQEQGLKKEQNVLFEKQDDWKQRHHSFQVKNASYEIFVEETKFKKMERDYLDVLTNQNEADEKLKTRNTDYYSLKLAELKVDQKEQEEQLSHIENELAKVDQTEEIEEYQEQLEEAKRALLGWYTVKIEKLEKEQEALNYQLNPILDQIGQLQEKKNDLFEKDKDIRDILSKTNGVIESRVKDIENLKQQLLSNPDQENVKEELARWQERSQFLDDEIIGIQQEIKLLVQEVIAAENQKETLQREFSETDNDKNKITYQLSAMEESQNKLIVQLATLREQWATVDNLYLSQESIEKRIIETLDKLMSEKTKLLNRERIAYRFVDDYAKQEVFFGDAFLEEQLATWKNQFDFLMTGVEYLQSIGPVEKENLKDYLLWPVTLVTTSKSKQKVMDKLEHISDHLQYPITVITPEDALLSTDDAKHQTWISPSHWHNNLDVASFTEWKTQIGSHAKEVTVLREQKEQEIRQWEEGRTAFNQFFTTYPYQEMTRLKEEQTRLNNRLEELETTIQKAKQLMKFHREKIDRNKEKTDQSREEKQGLEGKIEKAHHFLHYENEITKERKKVKELSANLEQVTKELVAVEKRLISFNGEKEELMGRVSEMGTRLSLIQDEDAYKALQSFAPIFTDESETTINQKIKDLEMKIRRINQSQGELLAKKEAAVQTIHSLNRQIVSLIQEHSNLNESREFPDDGKQLMQRLWQQITELRVELEALEDNVQSKKSIKDRQEGKWKTKIEQFEVRYQNKDILTFTQSLAEIEEELQAEKSELEERKTYIEQELARIEKELNSVGDAKYGLELFVEGHHFNAPDVIPSSLTAEEVLDFTYKRKRFVASITNELKSNKDRVVTEQKEVDKAKRRFRDFCTNQISDIKLQQMAINGVDSKNNYEDISEFRKNMLTRIDKISFYANEHIRQSDEDLQLFITQINSHLVTLVEELKQIPKKTRVKVVDDWKQVFTFTIPEWEEEVGKMRIRDHIEWILKQLESDNYLNEKGLQDDGKVRKDIEMWLQSKQLLQIIMNHEGMKVNCRKVNNDNTVSTRSYSWELSNVWSGGEKWSKNMTLFLGILNYVAEKKKHIQPNMKRHRAVILDNPFGKASSDHVLSPVFFVAEQLGFQIIALTAHAEGKFLQDYFPVIYSCRLRSSMDPSKKVMTKEKWLHHAYFQDHDPDTIDRIGETEQMGLFD